MHGRGVCVVGGAWCGACMAGGCAWQGACMAGEGACVAGEMATAAGATHPTGMRSCFVSVNSSLLCEHHLIHWFLSVILTEIYSFKSEINKRWIQDFR